MSEKWNKFQEDLDKLISRGDLLHMAIRYECHGENFKKQVANLLGDDKVENYIEKLPDFRKEYQSWYSEAIVLLKQVLPDRVKDFVSHYEYPRVRKEITYDNYMVRDYLQDLQVTIGQRVIVDSSGAIPEFVQQLAIVKAARKTLESSLMDLTLILQADLFDSEVDSARSLANSGYFRAAGAICGVVIEKHLKQVCDTHGVVMRKKNKTIGDYNQALKDQGAISIPQWRFVQHLADIRNLCDHAKGREPEKKEIEDLVSGTEKILKTIF